MDFLTKASLQFFPGRSESCGRPKTICGKTGIKPGDGEDFWLRPGPDNFTGLLKRSHWDRIMFMSHSSIPLWFRLHHYARPCIHKKVVSWWSFSPLRFDTLPREAAVFFFWYFFYLLILILYYLYLYSSDFLEETWHQHLNCSVQLRQTVKQEICEWRRKLELDTGIFVSDQTESGWREKTADSDQRHAKSINAGWAERGGIPLVVVHGCQNHFTHAHLRTCMKRN